MGEEIFKTIKGIDKLVLRVITIYFLVSLILTEGTNIILIFNALKGNEVFGFLFEGAFLFTYLMFVFSYLTVAKPIMLYFQHKDLHIYYKKLIEYEDENIIISGKSIYANELYSLVKKYLTSIVDFIILAYLAVVLIIGINGDNYSSEYMWVPILLISVISLPLMLYTLSCKKSLINQIIRYLPKKEVLVAEPEKPIQIEVL